MTIKTRTIASAAAALIAFASIGFLTARGSADESIRPSAASDVNLRRIERSLERDIDMMQHDRHDYGGHRVDAIKELQAARGEIAAAERYDRTH